MVAELRPGELRAAQHPQWETADPANRAADDLWWNWCRMPAGVSARDESSVAVLSAVMPHLREWLGRDLTAHATGVEARAALLRVL